MGADLSPAQNPLQSWGGTAKQTTYGGLVCAWPARHPQWYVPYGAYVQWRGLTNAIFALPAAIFVAPLGIGTPTARAVAHLNRHLSNPVVAIAAFVLAQPVGAPLPKWVPQVNENNLCAQAIVLAQYLYDLRLAPSPY